MHLNNKLINSKTCPFLKLYIFDGGKILWHFVDFRSDPDTFFHVDDTESTSLVQRLCHNNYDKMLTKTPLQVLIENNLSKTVLKKIFCIYCTFHVKRSLFIIYTQINVSNPDPDIKKKSQFPQKSTKITTTTTTTTGRPEN